MDVCSAILLSPLPPAFSTSLRLFKAFLTEVEDVEIAEDLPTEAESGSTNREEEDDD